VFTRFSTPTLTHLFAPGRMLRYSPRGPGASFLTMLGGAYECETEQSVGNVVQEAALLLAVLQDASSEYHVSAPNFASRLERLLRFLKGCDAHSVRLYSYEKPPTLDELLAAGTSGGGADDWAMEEVLKRGGKMIPKLEAVLGDADRSRQHLSAVRFLIFCFPGSASREIVRRFVASAGDTEEKRGAAILLAATELAAGP
jgi:hypothetical protein